MLLAMVWASASTAKGAPVFHCPALHRGAPLATVILYDGPPAEHADLAPDRYTRRAGRGYSTWDVAYVAKAGRRLYVGCGYGAGNAIVSTVPRSVRQCTFTSSRRRNALRCG